MYSSQNYLRSYSAMASASSSSGAAMFNERIFQLGLVNEPCQIVTHGFPSDKTKATSSVQMVIKDSATIKALNDLEMKMGKDATRKNLKLNSNIIRTAKDSDGNEYPVIRCKFTRNADNYSTVHDPWGSGAPLTLEGLEYGSLVIATARPVPWYRSAECGITLYCNQVRGIARTETPIGRREQPEFDWK